MTKSPEPVRADFDHGAMIRDLIQQATHGTLGTLDGGGAPFASLVALARDEALRPIIITSHLSSHTGHLEADSRVSLLIAAIGKGDPLAHPRLTLTGRAEAARPGDLAYADLRTRYLTQNPKAQLYVDLPASGSGASRRRRSSSMEASGRPGTGLGARYRRPDRLPPP